MTEPTFDLRLDLDSIDLLRDVLAYALQAGALGDDQDEVADREKLARYLGDRLAHAAQQIDRAREMGDLIEQSSLADPQAKALRPLADRSVVDTVLNRSISGERRTAVDAGRRMADAWGLLPDTVEVDEQANTVSVPAGILDRLLSAHHAGIVDGADPRRQAMYEIGLAAVEAAERRLGFGPD